MSDFMVEINQLKSENNNLKLAIKSMLKLLNDLNINLNENLNASNDEKSNETKNKYNGYEQECSLDKSKQNREWDWENKPIKSGNKTPISILSSKNGHRRRSKSVCFGERELVFELTDLSTEINETIEVQAVSEPDEKIIETIYSNQVDEDVKKANNNKVKKKTKESKSNELNILKDQIEIKQQSTQLKDVVKLNDNEIEAQTSSKCSCSGDCLKNRCGCKKNGSFCNSKCHNGIPCKNRC